MKKFNFAILAGTSVILAIASQARADGFICGTDDRELQIQVYNKTNPAQGTRTASVMVLSDPTEEAGQQTLGRFTQINETLTNQGPVYTAFVQDAISNGHEVSEFAAGTRLKQVRTIHLSVNFNYANPVPDNAIVSGTLTFEKLNGSMTEKQITCNRYLKNG